MAGQYVVWFSLTGDTFLEMEGSGFKDFVYSISNDVKDCFCESK